MYTPLRKIDLILFAANAANSARLFLHADKAPPVGGGIEAEWKIAPFPMGCNTGAAAAVIFAADVAAGAGSLIFT